MSLEVLCSCGKRFSVPEAHAGRRVKCPRCGEVMEVPAAGTPAAHEPGRGPGRTWVWLILGLLILGGAGGGLAWWLLRGKGGGAEADGPEVTDVQLLPGNAQGLATVRLAELWALPEVKTAIEAGRKGDPNQEDPAARMERDTGLKPDDVERLHVVVIDADRRLGWAVARTAKPADRKQILARVKEQVERRHEGRRYYLGKNEQGQEVAVYFGGPRIVVVSNEEGMKRCLDQANKPVTEGPLAPVIDLADKGKSQVVVGLYPRGGGLETIKKNTSLKWLAEVRVARATADVGKEVVLDTRATVEDEKAAQTIRAELTSAMGLLQIGIGLTGFLKKGEEKMALDALSRVTKAVQVTTKGNEVMVTAKVNSGDLVLGLSRGLPQLTKLAGGQ